MTTHRRYTFYTHLKDGIDAMSDVVELACRRYWWFGEPVVYDDDDGNLIISFLVQARDQWWAHKRATNLCVDAVYAAGGTEADVPAPTWVKLPPHETRGVDALLNQDEPD